MAQGNVMNQGYVEGVSMKEANFTVVGENTSFGSILTRFFSSREDAFSFAEELARSTSAVVGIFEKCGSAKVSVEIETIDLS